MNVLNEQVVEEMPIVLDLVEGNPDVKGALVMSGKQGSFIAGADIKMLEKMETAQEVEAIARRGQVGYQGNSNFKFCWKSKKSKKKLSMAF